jgi:hypothetical protein
MEGNKEKIQWVSPNIIVWIRNTEEEAVLSTCKYDSWSGANNYNNGCFSLNACSGAGCATRRPS